MKHKWICLHCQSIFKLKKDLMTHKLEKHSKIGAKVKQEILENPVTLEHENLSLQKCSICGIDTFHSETDLKKHIEIEHQVKKIDSQKFSCDMCSSVFRWERNLKEHKAIKHSYCQFKKVTTSVGVSKTQNHQNDGMAKAIELGIVSKGM